jgi:hypothetical protein
MRYDQANNPLTAVPIKVSREGMLLVVVQCSMGCMARLAKGDRDK